MTKNSPQKVVDDLLRDLPPARSRAVLAGNPELVSAIRHFFELKASGDPRACVSFAWFYNNKLRARFNGPHLDAVRRYVQGNLRINVTTGKAMQ